MHHPLRQILPRARTLGDADAGAAAHPEILQPGGRSDEKSAIRRVGDGPADDPHDPRVLERRDPLGGQFEPRHQAVDVGRQQLGVERPVDAVQRPCLGAIGLVGADDQPLPLLAVVARRAGVADDRGLALQRGDRVEVFGHQILMDDVDDRDLEPDHGPDPGREPAGGVDHVFGDDGALLGDDVPASVGPPDDVDDPVAEIDLGAAGARAGGHGHGAAGGIGVPVARRVGAQQHALGVQQRVQGGDLGGTDEVALRADAAQHALHIVEPVDLVPIGRKPDGAAAVPARGLAGLRLQPLVEPGAVKMHLGHVEAADEMRNQPGRVPGRAGCKLAFLDQDQIRPPLLGEVVEESDPHDAAADHGDARMGFHPRPRSRIGRRAGSTDGMTLDIATSPLRPTREP